MKSLRRILVVAVAVLIATSMLVGAAQVIQGKIMSVDPSGKMITLHDGTQLTIPPEVKVSRDTLKEGVDVKATFEVKNGLKVVTSIQVQPAKKGS